MMEQLGIRCMVGEYKGMDALLEQRGVDEILGQKEAGEAQEKMMRVKMGIYKEMPAVALDYCNLLSCGWVEQVACWANEHTSVAYLDKYALVLNTIGLLGIYPSLNMGMQDND